MVFNPYYIVLVVRVSVSQMCYNIQFNRCLMLKLINTSDNFYSDQLSSLMIKTFKCLAE